jgi:hypothetical protein
MAYLLIIIVRLFKGMSRDNHRNHAAGFHDKHKNRIIEAAANVLVPEESKVDRDQALDLAWRAVSGSRQAVRQRAAGAIAEYLRNGGELPLPMI